MLFKWTNARRTIQPTLKYRITRVQRYTATEFASLRYFTFADTVFIRGPRRCYPKLFATINPFLETLLVKIGVVNMREF